MSNNMIDLSVVVPIYNEESVLLRLYERLASVLEKLNMPYEIIFVDDSSRDKSFDMLKSFHDYNPKVKIISFSRNFGHQVAITAGINFSKGKAVMVIDGDLQDPPEIIPRFIQKWKEGNEVVYGIRLNRKENIFKRGAYKLYYYLLSKLAEIKIPRDSGDCCLMDRKVVDLLNAMPEKNRFIRGLRSWIGFKQAGLEFERDKRYAGKSKYTFLRLLKLGFDGIISFSKAPVKISIFAGLFISLLSIMCSFYLMFNRLIYSQNQLPGWTLVMVGVTFLGGLQMMIMGVTGEYIIRIYDEVKGRPQYITKIIIGFDNS